MGGTASIWARRRTAGWEIPVLELPERASGKVSAERGGLACRKGGRGRRHGSHLWATLGMITGIVLALSAAGAAGLSLLCGEVPPAM